MSKNHHLFLLLFLTTIVVVTVSLSLFAGDTCPVVGDGSYSPCPVDSGTPSRDSGGVSSSRFDGARKSPSCPDGREYPSCPIERTSPSCPPGYTPSLDGCRQLPSFCPPEKERFGFDCVPNPNRDGWSFESCFGTSYSTSIGTASRGWNAKICKTLSGENSGCFDVNGRVGIVTFRNTVCHDTSSGEVTKSMCAGVGFGIQQSGFGGAAAIEGCLNQKSDTTSINIEASGNGGLLGHGFGALKSPSIITFSHDTSRNTQNSESKPVRSNLRERYRP